MWEHFLSNPQRSIKMVFLVVSGSTLPKCVELNTWEISKELVSKCSQFLSIHQKVRAENLKKTPLFVPDLPFVEASMFIFAGVLCSISTSDLWLWALIKLIASDWDPPGRFPLTRLKDAAVAGQALQSLVPQCAPHDHLPQQRPSG